MRRGNGTKGYTVAQPPRHEPVIVGANDEPIGERARWNGGPIPATERYSPPSDPKRDRLPTSGRWRAEVAGPSAPSSERRDEGGPV